MAKTAHRFRRRLLCGALLLGLALALAYATRERTLGPLAVRLARAPLEELLGARLSVGRLGGNWFTHLIVEDLALEPLADGSPALVEVAGGRLELSFSPALFLGRLSALERIELTAERVRLDLRGEEGPQADAEEPPSPPPAALPELALALGALELRLEDELTLSASELRADGDGERLALAADLTWSEPGLTLELPLRARGAYLAARVTLEELALGDALVLSAGTLALGAREPPWELAGELLGGSLAAHGAGLGLELALERASLERLAPLFTPAPVLAGSLDARGALDLGQGTARLDLAGRALVLGGLRLDGLSGRLALSPETLALEELRAWRGDNVLDASELRLARATEGSADLLRSIEGSLHVVLRDLPLFLAEAPAHVPAHTLELSGRFRQGVLALETARVETEGGTLALRRGELRLAPGLDLAQARLALEADVAFEELAELARLVGRDDVRGALAGSVAVEGPLVLLQGALAGRVRGLQVLGRDLGDGDLRVAFEQGRVDLQELELDGRLGRLSASGAYDVADQTLHDARLEAEGLALEALGLASLSAGRVGISASASGPLSAPQGALTLRASGLVVAGVAADELLLRATAEGDRARVLELALVRGAGRLELAGELAREGAGAWSAALDALTASYGAGRLTLAEPCTLRVQGPARWTLEPLRLVGSGKLELAAERDGDSLRATLESERFDPSPLFASGPGTAWRTSGIDARIELVRAGSALSATFDVLVPELRLDAEDATWTAIARGGFDGTRLALERLVLEHARVGTLSASGSVPLDPLASDPLARFPAGELDLSASVDLELAALARRVAGLPPWLNGRLRAEARLAGGWRDARGRVHLSAEELALDALGVGFEGRRASLALDLLAAETCSLGPLSIASDGLGAIHARGDIAAPLDLGALLTQGLAAWREAALDLRLELVLDDIGWLARRTDELRRVTGALRGTLAIGGSLGAPTYEGTLDLDDGSLRLASDFPPIEALSARLRLQERTVELLELTGELGAAPLRARGSVLLAGPERAQPELALTLEGENLLLARTSGLRLRADTELTLGGPLSALRAQGELVLTEGRYGRDLDFLGALRGEAAPPSAGGRGFTLQFWREGPLASMQLDVGIRGGPLEIDNNVATLSVRPDLRLQGTGEVPLLVGRIYIEPGRLSLPSGSVAIDSGLVDFRASAPFAPRLELAGQTRIKGYDIGVRVSGDVLAPEVELWSTPPLPGDQLLVLFLTGEIPEGDTATRSEAAAKTVAVYLAKDFITRWMSDDSESDSVGLLERIEFEVGADVTRTGAPTTEVTYFFSDRPRATGWVPYLNAERDKYDKINMGVGLLFRLR